MKFYVKRQSMTVLSGHSLLAFEAMKLTQVTIGLLFLAAYTACNPAPKYDPERDLHKNEDLYGSYEDDDSSEELNYWSDKNPNKELNSFGVLPELANQSFVAMKPYLSQVLELLSQIFDIMSKGLKERKRSIESSSFSRRLFVPASEDIDEENPQSFRRFFPFLTPIAESLGLIPDRYYHYGNYRSRYDAELEALKLARKELESKLEDREARLNMQTTMEDRYRNQLEIDRLKMKLDYLQKQREFESSMSQKRDSEKMSEENFRKMRDELLQNLRDKLEVEVKREVDHKYLVDQHYLNDQILNQKILKVTDHTYVQPVIEYLPTITKGKEAYEFSKHSDSDENHYSSFTLSDYRQKIKKSKGATETDSIPYCDQL